MISLANLSDSFNRMLSEPKRFQKGIESIHKFVVLNYTLNSHISTLSYYLKSGKNNYRSQNLVSVIQATEESFSHAIHALESGSSIVVSSKAALESLNEDAERLLAAEKDKRKIAVEIKSFVGKSSLDDLEKALGQFVLYHDILKENEPERILYLAVRESVYENASDAPYWNLLLQNQRLRLIVFDSTTEEITQWIPQLS